MDASFLNKVAFVYLSYLFLAVKRLYTSKPSLFHYFLSHPMAENLHRTILCH